MKRLVSASEARYLATAGAADNRGFPTMRGPFLGVPLRRGFYSVWGIKGVPLFWEKSEMKATEADFDELLNRTSPITALTEHHDLDVSHKV